MPQLIDQNPIQFAYPTVRFCLKKNARCQGLIESVCLMAKDAQSYITPHWSNWNKPSLIASKNPGQLLAESLQYRFGHPKNMVFCETLNYHNQVMLVIIRNHQVYLEARVHTMHLADELMPLMNTKTPFLVVASRCSESSLALLQKIPQIKKLQCHGDSIMKDIPFHRSIQLNSWLALTSYTKAVLSNMKAMASMMLTRPKALGQLLLGASYD